MLQGAFEVINLLKGKVISCCNINPISITQEGIDIVEAVANKYGIEYLLNFKDRKEGTISEDDEKNDGNNGSIAEVDNEDEEKYAPTK